MKPTQVLDLNEEWQKIQDISEWLTKTCDTVVWSNYGRQPFVPGLLRRWETHQGFKTAMVQMSSEYINTFTDAFEYGHFDHTHMRFRYYRFRLDGSVKKVLLNEGPLISFPGLWDPCYYRANELVAAAICHEHLLLLWEAAPE